MTRRHTPKTVSIKNSHKVSIVVLMRPLILAYSETNDKNIAQRMGMPEYSYYFVLKWFLPALAKLGEVKVIHDPLTEADIEFDRANEEGRYCVLFSFAPPHRTLFPKRCPLIPLVAWEFAHIPDHSWDDSLQNDWRHVFKLTGLAITHSEFARQAILRAMPPNYPVWSIPAPTWDRFAERGRKLHGNDGRVPARGLDVHIRGKVIDSDTFMPKTPETGMWRLPSLRTLHEDKLARRSARRKRSLQKFLARITGRPMPLPRGVADFHIVAKGVVFATILNSRDGRKNWGDMATSFVSQFQDVEDAVLIFKFNEADSSEAFAALHRELRRFIWMKCRVIAFNGYLEDADFQRFLDGIDYVVNASTGEGQCLPLMELMAMGAPAVAPDHTSMADYITPENAFILPSNTIIAGWPHDPRYIYSTTAFKVHWDAMRDAYGRAYALAKGNPAKYQEMSRAAMNQLEKHSSTRVVTEALQAVLNTSIAQSKMKTKTTDYVYNDDDKGIADWMKNFTSRQGDGSGDPEEAYLQMIEVMAACKKTNWLEIGCGFGRLIPVISKYAESYTGIEPDFDRFSECAKQFHTPGRNISILNFSSDGYRNTNQNVKHGAIIVSMVIQHVSTQICKNIMSDVHSLLSDDGVAIISTTQTPVDLFTRQLDPTPISLEEYDAYASDPLGAKLGLPVRKFSKDTFLREIRDSNLELVAWNQFSYIREEKIDWLASLYGVPRETLLNVADSQYAIVRKAKSAHGA